MKPRPTLIHQFLAPTLFHPRFLTTTSHLSALAQKKPSPPQPSPELSPPPQPKVTPPPSSALANAPRSHGKAIDEFTPVPLDRPIGLPYRPQPGDNSGIETRTLGQRFADWKNVDNNRAKRKELTSKLSTPYFREWSNMRLHKGKTFLSPPRLFRSTHALYFPNLVGFTLTPRSSPTTSTTPTLLSHISIISVFAEQWALNQTQTFASKKSNPELQKAIEEGKGRVQQVMINVEEDWLKGKIQDLFRPWFRRTIDRKEWEKYFIVRKGFEREIREGVGMLNGKVGYVYLVDGEGRIRWAGSGDAVEGEREGLVKGVRFLLSEMEGKK